MNSIQGACGWRHWMPVLMVVAGLSFAVPALAQSDPPSNDLFDEAMALSGYSASAEGSNYLATAESGEPSHRHGFEAAHSVWYRWQAPSSGEMRLSITNLLVYFANSMALFEGTELEGLTMIDTLEDYSQRSMTNWVVGGTTYHIAVDVRPGSSSQRYFQIDLELLPLELQIAPAPQEVRAPGPLNLSVTNHAADFTVESLYYEINDEQQSPLLTEPPFGFSSVLGNPGPYLVRAVGTDEYGAIIRSPEVSFIARPVNDAFSSAIELEPSEVTQVGGGHNLWATAQTGEPQHATRVPQRSLWWSWTPAYSGTATLETGSEQDRTSVAIYTGAALEELTMVAIGHFVTETNQMSWPVEAGTTYRIAIDGERPVGDGELSWGLNVQTLFLELDEFARQPSLGDTVTIAARYTESDRPFTDLDYLVNGEVVDTVADAEQTYDWIPAAPGIYVLEAEGMNSLLELRRSDPVEITIGPANDHFDQPIELPSDAVSMATVTANTSFSSLESGEEDAREREGSGSVWLTWVSPLDGNVHFTWEGSVVRPSMELLIGESLDELISIEEVQYSNRYPLYAVELGQEYRVAVDRRYQSEGEFTLGVVPPPANDEFGSAELLPADAGSFEGTVLSTDFEMNEPPPIEFFPGSVWWKWVAPATGDFQIDTLNSRSCELNLAVYLGDQLQNLQAVVPDQFSVRRKWSGSGSGVNHSFRAVAGGTYYIRVSGRLYDDRELATAGLISGSYSFEVPPSIPTNDDYVDRVLLTGSEGNVVGDNTDASIQLGEVPFDAGNTWANRTVWYEYTSPNDGVLTVQPILSAHTHIVAVARPGTSYQDPEWIGHATRSHAFQMSVSQGETLVFMLDGANWKFGPFEFRYELTLAPHNNSFANSQTLVGSDIVVDGTLLAATGEPGEPLPTDDSVAKTVWWRWTAPTSGRLTVNAHNQGMGIYEGTAVDTLTPVVQDQGWLFVHVEEGRDYYLQLAHRPGFSQLSFTLNMSLVPYAETDNDMFADARRMWGLGGFSGTAGGSFLGASFEIDEPAAHTSGNDKSLWWRWQAPQSFDFRFYNSFSSTARGLTFTVYSGNSLTNLTMLAQGVDDCLVRGLNAGEDYYISICTPAGIDGGVDFELYSAGFPPPRIDPVPGNLFLNPNFEAEPDPRAEWQTSGVLNESPKDPAAGWHAIALSSGDIWQDVETVPGRRYRLRFAFGGPTTGVDTIVAAFVDDIEIGRSQNFGNSWVWEEYEFVASSNLSRVELRSVSNTIYLDGMSLVWLSEPPVILTQPASQSALVGREVLFQVDAGGTPPLSYQWFKNGETVSNATERFLIIDEALVDDAGEYHVLVSNEFGQVQSQTVELDVESVGDLVILLQPESRLALEGASLTLSVVAQSAREISYQWYRDEQLIVDETKQSLFIGELMSEHEGDYWCEMTDGVSTVVSIHAVVKVNPVTGYRAYLALSSFDFIYELSAPVYDVDGTTLLVGPEFLVQLYTGRELTELQPVGTPIEFNDEIAGHYFGPPMPAPATQAVETMLAQVRVWRAEDGASYEEARARGGRFGSSKIFDLEGIAAPAGQPPIPPLPLVGLESFSLRSGRPLFTTGEIRFNRWVTPGVAEWNLIGEAGFRYVIEVREAGNYWRPLLVLDNESGTAAFSDPEGHGRALKFYRSRILD